MSRVLVRCDEAEHLPAALDFPVEPGRPFDLFLLLEPLGSQIPLRRIVLRRSVGSGLPAATRARAPLLRCTLLVGPARFRVLERNPNLPVEAGDLDHPWRLGIDDEVPAGQALALDPPLLEKLRFALDVAPSRSRGLSTAVGASDWQRSPAQDLVVPKGWVTPDVAATLEAPKAAVGAGFKKVAAGLGNYRTAAFLVLPYVVFLGSGAVLYEIGVKDQKAAEQKAADLQAQLTASQQALAAAMDAEGACQSSRTSLADRLGDATAAARAAAATSLVLADTRQRVAGQGKSWVTLPELKAEDALLASATTDAVASGVLTAKDKPTAAEAQPCLAQDEALQDTVPRYILTWSPDESLFCPDQYQGVLGGVPRTGRWALNARIQRDFGPAAVAVSGEPLLNDRWAAYALANGVREIRDALLQASVRGRPPVAPAQADLWALALLDATDQLPSAASGALDLPATTCVQQLLVAVDGATKNPAIGQPVLPDLITVANGAPLVGEAPDPGCPWPAGAFEGAAQRALLAAERLALVEGKGS